MDIVNASFYKFEDFVDYTVVSRVSLLRTERVYIGKKEHTEQVH